MDWRDGKHRLSENQTSAHMVRLMWFHQTNRGPPLHKVRQAILDAIAVAIDEGMLASTVLQGGVVQLDDECSGTLFQAAHVSPNWSARRVLPVADVEQLGRDLHWP